VREAKLQLSPHDIMWKKPGEGIDDDSHSREDHDERFEIIAVPRVLERYSPVISQRYAVQHDADDGGQS
jgi:hypothetical protein